MYGAEQCALAIIAVFIIYPTIAVVYYSFTNYNIVQAPQWVGLANYQQLLNVLIPHTVLQMKGGWAESSLMAVRGIHLTWQRPFVVEQILIFVVRSFLALNKVGEKP